MELEGACFDLAVSDVVFESEAVLPSDHKSIILVDNGLSVLFVKSSHLFACRIKKQALIGCNFRTIRLIDKAAEYARSTHALGNQ